MFSLKQILICTSIILASVYVYKIKYNNNLPSPIVTISSGQLQGIVSSSRIGNTYYSYLRIPYAAPPIGQLRFEPPQPFPPSSSWIGVRDSSYYGSKCLQFDLMLRRTGGDEDCLFLNVFTPFNVSGNDGKSKKLAPVMVYIHGGLFLCGSSNIYEPKYFMDESNMVFVTINYRVGSLGFLNTGDGLVRGNMGLKDQTMALKWIQANIKAFGGNPGKVTIFGESAGASSVHYHMLSPLSKGLFHKAISQSGTALNHWALYDKPKEQAERFAKLHNCDRKSSKEMIDCLKSLDGFTLVDVHQEVMRPLRDWITIFNPTVETIDDRTAFLTQEPIDLLTKGKLSNVVPWIVGVNSHEGVVGSVAIFRNESMVIRIENDFDTAASNLFEIYPPNSSQIQQLRQFYGVGVQANNKIPTTINSNKFIGYTNLFSDRMFNLPLHHSVKLQSSSTAPPIFLYYYTYPREVSIAEFILAARGRFPILLEVSWAFISSWIQRNLFGMKIHDFGGPAHGDDVSIFFPVPWDKDITTESVDFEFSKDIVKLWVDFAKNDNEKILKFRNIDWHPIDPKVKTLKYLQLDTDPKIIDEPFFDRIKFWNTLNIKIQ